MVSGFAAALVTCAVSIGSPAQAPPANASVHESSMTATVDRINRAERRNLVTAAGSV